jgi:glycosyltransferase involved in cell wall biosynthesis
VSCYFVCHGLPADRNYVDLIFKVQAARDAAARQALDAGDVVTAPSRYLIDKYHEYGFGSGRIQLAPLGLNPVERIESKPRSAPAFGFLGAIVPLKNPLLLARAFQRVRGEATLTFFGWGSDLIIAELQRMIEADRRIRYAGPYRPQEVGRVLSELDVLVQPSLSESYSLVTREGLSAGIPVVASRVGAIPEAVEHGRNGLLFEPDDESGLVECMQALVDNPQLLEQLRRGIGPIKTLGEDAAEWVERYRALCDAKSLDRPALSS